VAPDGAGAPGDGIEQMPRREGPVQVDLDEADRLAVGLQVLHGLAHGIGPGAHDDDHPLCLRIAEILEQPVLPAGELGEFLHVRLHDSGRPGVVGIDGLAALEIHVGVLRRAAHEGVIRIESALAVGDHQVVADHRADLRVGEQGDLVHLVRGAEAVEEVDEGDARLQRARLGDQGEVVGLLHGTRGQLGEAGGAHGHDVLVVAEDGQALGGERTRRHVEDRRGELAGDLVHVRNHEHQPLGGGEGRRQGAGLQGAVGRARGAALALHLGDDGYVPPEVGLAFGCPLVGKLGHGGRGRDGVDGADFVGAVGHVGRRLVTFDRDYLPVFHSCLQMTGRVSRRYGNRLAAMRCREQTAECSLG
jgi:hypothetical protein